MKQYDLLKYHMDPNPNYLFGHAEIAGMLASNDERINTFNKYTTECRKKGISPYGENCYNRFILECGRELIQKQEDLKNESELNALENQSSEC